MEFLFFAMALVLTVSAIGVVVLRNALHSALCLILNLLTMAGLFAQLDAHFLSTVQILVYAGAIMVLVIFVLMLLNIKSERRQAGEWLFSLTALILGCLFVGIVAPHLYRAFSVFPDPAQPLAGTVKAIGELLYSRYVFAFEAASLLIMAAIVGAVMLAKRKSRAAGDSSGGHENIVQATERD